MTTFLDLPREIIGQILHAAYNRNIAICGLVFSCREMYYNYRHLVYLPKEAYIEEYISLKSRKKDPQKPDLLEIMLNNDGNIISNVQKLKIHSHLSTRFINKQDSKVLQFVPEYLPRFSKLIVLNLTLNSINLLFDLLTSLPNRLKVLIIRLEITKVQLSLTQLKNLKSKTNLISHCPELKYFELVSHKNDFTLSAHLHVELTTYLFHPARSEEVVNREVSNRTSQRILQRMSKVSHEYKVKIKLCHFIYQFLSINSESLLKIEIIRFDLNLIFNNTLDGQSPSLGFKNLRILSFDSTSRINLARWFTQFQLCNMKPTFRDNHLLFLCHDVLASCLYYKDASVVRNYASETIGEIDNWSFSHLVCQKYLQLHRLRELEY